MSTWVPRRFWQSSMTCADELGGEMIEARMYGSRISSISAGSGISVGESDLDELAAGSRTS